jgi:hypothetical protein
MLQTKTDGRIALLYVESRPGDSQDEGMLHFVEEDEGNARRQRLVAGDEAYARRARSDAATLVFGPDGEPIVAFRLRTARNSPYDGAIQLGRRTARRQWTFQTIHQHGNWGFYPILRLDREGRPAELVHFSFGGFYLVRSAPEADILQEWTTRLIGQQGDGLHLVGVGAPDGTLHMMFRANRCNNDPSPSIFARWDGQQLHREIVDPIRPATLCHLAFAPDGAPVVLNDDRLMRRISTGWSDFGSLPRSSATGFEINGQGTVYFVDWDGGSHRLVLWKGRQNTWSAQSIADKFPEGEPNWCAVQLDQAGRPIVVAARLGEPYGWVQVLRRKE